MDLDDASAVTLYLLPDLNRKLIPILLRDLAPALPSCRTPSTWVSGRRTAP